MGKSLHSKLQLFPWERARVLEHDEKNLNFAHCFVLVCLEVSGSGHCHYSSCGQKSNMLSDSHIQPVCPIRRMMMSRVVHVVCFSVFGNEL